MLLALLAVPVTILQSALSRSSEKSELAEDWAFVRLVITGLFALLVGQLLTPSGYLWWANVLLAIFITLLMVFTTQVIAKLVAHRPVGEIMMKALDPMIRRVNLMFTPLSGPKVDAPEEFEQELLESVEDFTETIAREVMVPRIDMETVPSDATLDEALSLFLKGGFSRMPLTGKSVDDILGVLYLKDIARIKFEGKTRKTKMQDFVRPAIFTPDSKGVDDLLRDMQQARVHMAIVVDEYGGVAGLVTLEDLIEEIVGEISDEYDVIESELVELGDSRYRVEAGYSLFDLGETLELELEDEDDEVDSVGGLLVKHLGRLARKGESVEVAGIKITAERIEGRSKRLITVIVERSTAANAAAEAFESKA